MYHSHRFSQPPNEAGAVTHVLHLRKGSSEEVWPCSGSCSKGMVEPELRLARRRRAGWVQVFELKAFQQEVTCAQRRTVGGRQNGHCSKSGGIKKLLIPHTGFPAWYKDQRRPDALSLMPKLYPWPTVGPSKAGPADSGLAEQDLVRPPSQAQAWPGPIWWYLSTLPARHFHSCSSV